MAKYKIVIPKAGASNELGTETKLYELDEIVDAKEPWQKEMMGAFSDNGWAIEVKVDAPEEILVLMLVIGGCAGVRQMLLPDMGNK